MIGFLSFLFLVSYIDVSVGLELMILPSIIFLKWMKKSTFWLIPVRVSQHWSNLVKNGMFEILNSWIIGLIDSRPNRNKKASTCLYISLFSYILKHNFHFLGFGPTFWHANRGRTKYNINNKDQIECNQNIGAKLTVIPKWYFHHK